MQHPDKIFGRLGNRMFQMAYIYAQAKKGMIPDIYVQDLKLFEKYGDEIKKWFGEGVGYLDFVSIHVRVGTNPSNPNEPAYKDNPFYVNLLETDYYQKAINMFPKDKFIVFSDDPEYVKTLDIFKYDRFQIIDKGDEVEDLNIMASCKSNIIANSSYSWWAAFLNPNWGKTVVAPKKWFTDGKAIPFPKEWIIL